MVALAFTSHYPSRTVHSIVCSPYTHRERDQLKAQQRIEVDCEADLIEARFIYCYVH